MNYKELFSEINKAYNRINQYICDTPLIFSPYLSSNKSNVFLKLENCQYTGSFKIRGAMNKILKLSDEDRSKGVITASTGNHGLATAYALDQVNSSGTIYLPTKAQEVKIKKLKNFNVNLVFEKDDSGATEVAARRYAEENKITYISPYNDFDIIAGQGTIAVELDKKLKEIDNIFVTVGGGGLISGIASYLKKINPKIRIFGCQPENSPVMYESIKAGHVINYTSKDTLSDGSSGGVENDCITFDICKELINQFVLVNEEEIKNAIRLIFNNHNQIIEGAAGVAVGSYLKIKSQIKGNTIIIICGGNIDPKIFQSIICV